MQNKKLQLNKKIVAELNEANMSTIKGGVKVCIQSISIHSCARGTEKRKTCCFRNFTEIRSTEDQDLSDGRQVNP